MKNVSKIYRLLLGVAGGFLALALALVAPILAQTPAVVRALPTLAKNGVLISWTFAQTAPATIDEMGTAVTGFATQLVPGWLMYVVFVLIAALAIWLISRALRSMKH